MIFLHTRNIDYSGYRKIYKFLAIQDEQLCTHYEFKFNGEFRQFILNHMVYNIGDRNVFIAREIVWESGSEN